MAIEIGGAPAENLLTNPLGLLYSCHRRITLFLEGMMTVTQAHQGKPLSPQQRQGLSAALRYFREAAPKHILDEEVSLFPRMLEIQDPAMKTVREKLANLRQGHREVEDDHQKVDEWVQRWLDQGDLPRTLHQSLSESLDRLSVFYELHMEIEETEIFPLAEKRLAPGQVAAIGEEMAIRRGLAPDALKQLTDDLKKSSP